MALELITINHAANTSKQLHTKQELSAGDKVKMELGNEELDTVVPEGETWSVSVQILIDVT